MPKDPEEYLNINQRAQLRFSQLKQEMKITAAIPVLEKEIKEQFHDDIRIDRKKLEDFIVGKSVPDLERYNTGGELSEEGNKEIQKAKEFIDDSFSFIDSLNLPPQLSLAIGLIIAGNAAKDRFEIIKAIDTLRSFDHKKNWGKI